MEIGGGAQLTGRFYRDRGQHSVQVGFIEIGGIRYSGANRLVL